VSTEQHRSAQVPLAGGMSLLSWLALAGLGVYAGVSTVSRVSCEIRLGADRCADVRREWSRDMTRAGTGFMLLFAHSPGEGGLGGIVKLLSGGRKREDQGLDPVSAIGDLALSADAVTRLIGPPPERNRFSEGEPVEPQLALHEEAEKADERDRVEKAAAVARRRKKHLEELSAMNVAELREKARGLGLAGVARNGRRDELLTVLGAMEAGGR
jgi:hypothetical protein